MRVLILNQAFYPDVVSSGQHAADLAESLAGAGHDVTVVASSRGYDDPARRFPARETWRKVRILRVSCTGLGKASRWRRALDFATFMMGCAARVLLLPRFDVVIAMTSPPLISFLAALLVPLKAGRLLFWCMDLNPDEAIVAGWLRPDSWPARMLSRLQLFSMRRAARIIALDCFMEARITAKGIPAEKIVVVAPWSHDAVVRFDAAARERFRARHGLSDNFVVMYSGNHSPCHPLDSLLEAAQRLAQNPDILFLFVGGGSEFRKPLALEQSGLPNVRCLPYQSQEDLAGSLSAADLHVCIMGGPFVGIVHPCKVYNIIAVAAPLLYIGPKRSHITDLVARPQGNLLVFTAENGDVETIVQSILQAAQSGSDRAPARELTNQFSRQALVPRMIRLLETMADQRPRTAATVSASGQSS